MNFLSLLVDSNILPWMNHIFFWWSQFGDTWQKKHFSPDAANFSLFSWEEEVTFPLISGPAWTLRLQFTKYQQSYAPMKFYLLIFFFIRSASVFTTKHVVGVHSKCLSVLHKNICCVYSLEVPQCAPQKHMLWVLIRNASVFSTKHVVGTH